MEMAGTPAGGPGELATPRPDGVPLQRSLPGRSYTSEAEFALERDRVLLPGWFCVGRTDSLAEPGCYLAADVCGESIIVARTDTGGLAGYYNLCRHRGSRLVPRAGEQPPAGLPVAAPSTAGTPIAAARPGDHRPVPWQHPLPVPLLDVHAGRDAARRPLPARAA